jgi:DsbC/DsbD-like thiol-disulfide interchange protein
MMINRTLTAFFCFALLALPANFYAFPGGMDASDVKTEGVFSADKAQRGRTIQAAVVFDIPDGYHVNGNKPLGKFSIPTQLTIESPRGLKVGPVIYPRASVKSFSFSQEKLAVFEGRAVIRFGVTIPAGFKGDGAELRARIRFQSCTDEVCFPPDSRDIKMWIKVVDSGDAVKNVNASIFGSRRR